LAFAGGERTEFLLAAGSVDFDLVVVGKFDVVGFVLPDEVVEVQVQVLLGLIADLLEDLCPDPLHLVFGIIDEGYLLGEHVVLLFLLQFFLPGFTPVFDFLFLLLDFAPELAQVFPHLTDPVFDVAALLFQLGDVDVLRDLLSFEFFGDVSELALDSVNVVLDVGDVANAFQEGVE